MNSVVVNNYQVTKKYDLGHRRIRLIRLFFLLFLVFDEILLIAHYENNFYSIFHSKMKFLTNQGEFLTQIYFLLMVLFQVDKQMTTQLSTFFQILYPIEVIITLVYWLMIHKNSVRKEQNQTFTGMFLLYSQHIAPLLFLTIDFLFNNLILIKSKSVLMMYLLFYTCVQYYYTVFRQEIIYDFIDFKEKKAFLIAIILGFVCLLFWKFTHFLQNFKFSYVKVKNLGE